MNIQTRCYAVKTIKGKRTKAAVKITPILDEKNDIENTFDQIIVSCLVIFIAWFMNLTLEFNLPYLQVTGECSKWGNIPSNRPRPRVFWSWFLGKESFPPKISKFYQFLGVGSSLVVSTVSGETLYIVKFIGGNDFLVFQIPSPQNFLLKNPLSTLWTCSIIERVIIK